MKNFKLFCLLISLFLLLSKASAQENSSIKSSQNSFTLSPVQKLASGFQFTEGPAVDAKGNVYFTDIPNHKIFIWTVNEELDTFRNESGQANGLYFDKDENLLACEGENGQITVTTPEGDYFALVTEYEGKRFNQTNDLWCNSKGGIYFTDPKYGRNSDELTQDGMHVYYFNPKKKSIIRVCDDLEKPNGVIGTPDGKILFVTDNKAEVTWKYDIQKNGTLKNKTLFVDLGCDGMTLDNQGNVYFTTNNKKAVDIFSPEGELLASIAVPEKPSNVCFGGEKRNLLYITARTSLYRVEMTTTGVD